MQNAYPDTGLYAKATHNTCCVDARSLMESVTIKINVVEHYHTGQKRRHLLHVGESENAMLYEIREQTGKFPFKLFFSKKDGFKFKKSFCSQQQVDWFIESYMRHCCLDCKQRGWVYKTQLPKPFRSTLNGGTKGFPTVGTVTICPECKTQHHVQHENVQYQVYGKTYTGTRLFLTKKLD